MLAWLAGFSGQFTWLHSIDVDSKGNLYATEVSTGRRIQKLVLTGIHLGHYGVEQNRGRPRRFSRVFPFGAPSCGTHGVCGSSSHRLTKHGLSGLAFRRAISSGTELAGIEGCTTSSVG